MKNHVFGQAKFLGSGRQLLLSRLALVRPWINDDQELRRCIKAGRLVIVPARSVAETIAAEWNAQRDIIDPLTMPATRFANSVVQGVIERLAWGAASSSSLKGRKHSATRRYTYQPLSNTRRINARPRLEDIGAQFHSRAN